MADAPQYLSDEERAKRRYTQTSTWGEFKNDVKNFATYGKNVMTGNAKAPDYQAGRPLKESRDASAQ